MKTFDSMEVEIFLEWINKVFYRFYCLLQNIHVPCRISLAIKTVLKFIGQQKVYVTCVHMHLFRVVNQMSLKKDLKFTTTTPHPPLDFSMTQNKCQMHRRCTLEAWRFIVVFVFDFFPVSFSIRSWVEKEILRYSKDVCWLRRNFDLIWGRVFHGEVNFIIIKPRPGGHFYIPPPFPIGDAW